MKTLIFALLLSSPGLALADKQPTVIVMPQPAQAEHRVSAQQPSTSLAVIQQQISDLSAAESRRDSVDQMLITSLNDKVNGDTSRIDHLESEAATIYTVGGLALTLLLAYAGWSATVSGERHRENRQTNAQIAAAIQSLSTAVAVIESKLGISLEHK